MSSYELQKRKPASKPGQPRMQIEIDFSKTVSSSTSISFYGCARLARSDHSVLLFFEFFSSEFRKTLMSNDMAYGYEIDSMKTRGSDVNLT